MKRLVAVLILVAGFANAQDRQPNHLLGAQSPYLLQHLYNPVNWYPWGEEALDRARNENKLIFVSVGYSSCHWCHVMADESFENEEIAAVLNEHFVSIKIDRERRPDLDEQFMLATQLLTKGGGWPNSVFLSPAADPFFGGTYIPRDEFQDLLLQIVDLWHREPDRIKAEGERVSAHVGEYLTRKADAADLTQQVVAGVANAVLAQTDPFSGGIGDTAKFPKESLFLFLLDQAERTGDTAMLAGVTNMLDAMIRGGIHDHVGGGFHRYTVDPDWRVPHFEKMLYNQALSGRLLVRAWAATGRPSYRRAAERLFAYVLRDLRDASGGFMAAEDADSDDGSGDHVEGAFYTWEQAAFGKDADALASYFDLSENGDLDGAHVLNLIDNPRALATGMGQSEADFFAALDPILDRLRQQRSARPRPGADSKVLMGWNGAMIATLAEAGHVLGRDDYRQAAGAAARHILNNMQNGTGFDRVWFDGQSGTPAQLSDYAALGLGLVALHDYSAGLTESLDWLADAHGLANQIRTRFGSPQDGFRMNEVTDGFSAVIPLDDSDIASGNAMALDLFARLAKRMPAPDMELNATRLAAALSGLALESPDQRGAILKASQELQFGEVATVRHVSSGAVRVEYGRSGNQITLNVHLSDGWHLNSHTPLEDYFIPLELNINGNPVSADTYPEPTLKSLGFNPKPLSLYEGSFSLTGIANGAGETVLRLQACSEEICLQPEELRFRIW